MRATLNPRAILGRPPGTRMGPVWLGDAPHFGFGHVGLGSPSRIAPGGRLPRMRGHTMQSYPNQLFVDGVYRASASGRVTPLVNPATEQAFVEVASAAVADVNVAVESAHKAWESGWRDLAPGKREAVLHAVARKLREHQEEIAQLERLHIGKPISDARDEAGLGARVFEFYAGAVTKFSGQTIPVARGGFDFTLRQSMGVVAAIVPWNFPFPIACWKAAPALAAGNCVANKRPVP